MSASLLVAGCGSGGSPGGDVAQLDTTAQDIQPASPSGASDAGGSQTSQLLAFAACMRSKGVPKFPDPTSSAKFPGAQQLGVTSLQYQTAMNTCKHLLPNGGNASTHPELQHQMTAMRPFSQCMRSHGVTAWPDPTVYTNTNGQTAVVFNFIGTSLDGNGADAPNVQAKIKACQHLLPPSHGGPAVRIVRN